MKFPISLLYRPYRFRQPELMDTPGLNPEVHQAALQGLETIATWPGQRRPILSKILEMAASRESRRPLTLVELGAGSGHLSHWLAGQLAAHGVSAKVTPTDLTAGPGVRKLDATDGRRFPKADIFFSNLCWHHLTDPQVAASCQAMTSQASLGWLAFDLHRHFVHYYSALLILKAARLHPILASDGTKSIQQGFNRRDLSEILAAAGVNGAQIQWSFPFRWMVSWQRK
jgi:hypothetical protein